MALFKWEIELRSFQQQPDNRRSIYLQLAGSIEIQLRQAYATRHEKDGLTQTMLAERLGINRSVVNRRLSGRSNMTIETIAEMLWALGHCANVEIFDPAAVKTNKFHIVPDATVDSVSKTSATTQDKATTSSSIYKRTLDLVA